MLYKTTEKNRIFAHMDGKMKHLPAGLLLLLAVCCTKPEGGGTTDPDPKPVETAVDLSGYKIVYAASAEPEEGADLAALVREAVKAKTGKTLAATTDDAAESANEILLGKTNRSASNTYYAGKPGIFDYCLSVRDGKILVAGGGCWAMEKAADFLKREKLVNGLERKGSIYGERLFPRESGANLRILDDNVWEYNSASNAAAWAAVGANCTDAVRSIGFAGLVFAYLPDIVCFQEYSKDMDKYLRPRLETKGYLCSTSGSDWNFTPIFYNSTAVTLEKAIYHRFTPSTFSNGGTKSYTSAVFTLKANGKKFGVIGTHLWWKSESAYAGSNAAREAQAAELLKEAESIRDNYGCPVFITGDMNCTLLSNAMKNLVAGGCTPVFNVATVHGDKRNGYHACSADGFSRQSNKSDDGFGCIDQFFVYNQGTAEIKTFWRIEPYFTVELTDHYPNYADIVIN